MADDQRRRVSGLLQPGVVVRGHFRQERGVDEHFVSAAAVSQNMLVK